MRVTPMHIETGDRAPEHPRARRRGVRRVALATSVALSLVASAFAQPPGVVAATPASPTPAGFGCAATEKLVNPCRPWLGAYGHGYPQVPSDLRSQVAFHEQRAGRTGDIVRG